MQRFTTRSCVTLLIASITILCSGKSRSEDQPREEPIVVSIVRLIAVPDRYDGKKILTFGFGEFGLENNILYLSKSDADHGILANSVWISLDSYGGEPKALHRGYIEVEGTFDASVLRGPGWQHFAGLIRATAIEALPLGPQESR